MLLDLAQTPAELMARAVRDHLADCLVTLPRLDSSGRSPTTDARQLMQALGEGLGQAVGQRLEHDRAVVVVIGLEAGDVLIDPDAGGHGEGADPIAPPGRGRREIVGSSDRLG
jgi:hypothetical protein